MPVFKLLLPSSQASVALSLDANNVPELIASSHQDEGAILGTAQGFLLLEHSELGPLIQFRTPERLSNIDLPNGITLVVSCIFSNLKITATEELANVTINSDATVTAKTALKCGDVLCFFQCVQHAVTARSSARLTGGCIGRIMDCLVNTHVVRRFHLPSEHGLIRPGTSIDLGGGDVIYILRPCDESVRNEGALTMAAATVAAFGFLTVLYNGTLSMGYVGISGNRIPLPPGQGVVYGAGHATTSDASVTTFLATTRPLASYQEARAVAIPLATILHEGPRQILEFTAGPLLQISSREVFTFNQDLSIGRDDAVGVRVDVSTVPAAGFGLFALVDFTAGQHVACYHGELICPESPTWRKQGHDTSYGATVPHSGSGRMHYLVDSRVHSGESLGRYINRPPTGCAPNVRLNWKDTTVVGSGELPSGYLHCVATRTIPINAEIWMAYGAGHVDNV